MKTASYLAMYHNPTDIQHDVARHSALLSSDQLWRRRSCSRRLDVVEVKHQRWTCCTTPQYRLINSQCFRHQQKDKLRDFVLKTSSNERLPYYRGKKGIRPTVGTLDSDRNRASHFSLLFATFLTSKKVKRLKVSLKFFKGRIAPSI